MSKARILVIDDDASVRRVLKLQLEEAGYEVHSARDSADAEAALSAAHPQLVITDLMMPGGSGLELLQRIRSEGLDTTVIIITAFGSVETAVSAMRSGAYDYITKPIDYDALVLAVDRALERQNLIEEVRTLRSALDERYGFENIMGHSKALLRVLDMASRVAQHDSTVLIQGETGTGKELLARAIHHNSRRRNRPFATINCGAIPGELLESELFGFTRGAFTGAHATKPGKIEMADGGTLFLDEIGELPLEMQVKLLRLLQNGELEKVGSTTPKTVNIRVLAATNRNLQAMIEDGTFREDLYYRLAVVPLVLPPLRERKDDIPELVQHIFTRLKERHGMSELKMSPGLRPLLTAYRWPGNVRELENVMERLVVLSSHDEVTEHDLPDEIRGVATNKDTFQLELPDSGISLEAVEKELLLRALQRFDWNQSQAARFLDISRRTLIYRMEKHGLRRDSDVDHVTLPLLKDS
jgi:two-component system NtrC family response regulator